MHTVAIRREVYEKNPWIARNLYKGFADSKKLALARMRSPARNATCFRGSSRMWMKSTKFWR